MKKEKKADIQNTSDTTVNAFTKNDKSLSEINKDENPKNKVDENPTVEENSNVEEHKSGKKSFFNKAKEKMLLSDKENQPSHRKMCIYIIVVNYGWAETIMKLLKECGSVVQLATLAEGTAKQAFFHMISMEDLRKDLIIAFADENNCLEIQLELTKTFMTNKRMMGIGFSIPLTSIVGEKIYHFLTNSL